MVKPVRSSPIGAAAAIRRRDDNLSLAEVGHIAHPRAHRRPAVRRTRSSEASCVLPGGHRFECLTGPSVQSGLSLAIRCKHPFRPSWSEIGATAEVASYLRRAAAAGRAIVVSGATNSGKTTLLNMLLAELPADRRVIALEDAPELHLERFADGNGLLAAREGGGGDGMVGWRQLHDHLMRITPDCAPARSRRERLCGAGAELGVTGFVHIHADSPAGAAPQVREHPPGGDALDRVPELTGRPTWR